MTLDMNDKINLLHLALKGQGTGVTYKSYEISDYLDYIRELSTDRSIDIDKLGLKDSSLKIVQEVPEFFQNLLRNLKNEIKDINIKESVLVSLINKLKLSDFNFTDDEFEIVYGSSISAYHELLADINIPKLTRVTNRDDQFVNDVRRYAREDKLFNYSISNVYRVDATNKRDFSRYQYSMRGVHGTRSMSLLSILENGFMLPSQLVSLNKEFRRSGSSLGDGVYFARLDQISKTSSYLDSSSAKTKYAIVADLYYNEKVETLLHQPIEYTGQNLLHAIKQGSHERDEIVVLPSQIDIKYVVEMKILDK